jgi:hypothetical protein
VGCEIENGSRPAEVTKNAETWGLGAVVEVRLFPGQGGGLNLSETQPHGWDNKYVEVLE